MKVEAKKGNPPKIILNSGLAKKKGQRMGYSFWCKTAALQMFIMAPDGHGIF